MMRRGAWTRLVRSIHADHAKVNELHRKYLGEESAPPLATGLVQRIGLQMIAAYRVMRFFVDARIPIAPKIVSRLIRLTYGADIHWHAEIADGVVIVHGMGIAISRSAHVGSGSVLFQNVTLGEVMDPVSRIVGAPQVAENVHIGPGATLLGPITIGAGSKIAAGTLVRQSVPPNSIVEPAPPVVSVRKTNAVSPRDGEV